MIRSRIPKDGFIPNVKSMHCKFKGLWEHDLTDPEKNTFECKIIGEDWELSRNMGDVHYTHKNISDFYFGKNKGINIFDMNEKNHAGFEISFSPSEDCQLKKVRRGNLLSCPP